MKTVRLPINRYDLYLLAEKLLSQYLQRSARVHKRAMEVAFAIQYFRDQIPMVGEAPGMLLSEVATRLCDGLYRKRDDHLPRGPKSQDLIWPLLYLDSDGHPQPLLPQGNGEDFRWHKLMNGQRGIGCHAAARHFWLDAAFVETDRDLCPFRVYDGETPLMIDQGRQKCGFDGNPCGWEPGMPKFLQVLGRGLEARMSRIPWTVAMWQSLVPSDQPLPVYPVICGLYFGSELCRERTHMSPGEFQADFGFEDDVFGSLFDFDPDHPLNRRFLSQIADPAPGEALVNPFIRSVLPKDAGRGRPTGGRLVIDPDEKPLYQKHVAPSSISRDPLLAERRRRRQLERTAQHDEVLTHFRRWFRLASKEVREDADTFDFLAIDEELVLLAEIKILGQQDIADAVQEVVGQLMYYERFALAPWREEGYLIVKAAVFERPPFGEYIAFLRDLGISTFWIDETTHIDGPEESLALLRNLGVKVHPDPELA